MCGIVGYSRIDGGTLDGSYLLDMQQAVQTMKHRGPNDSGVCGFDCSSLKIFPATHSKELLGNNRLNGLFGFTRLSIKDLSSAGHQPMLSEDEKVAIVFNGEIYNDDLLRKDLISKGYRFRSTCDTEVILNCYLEYGIEEMLHKLNGMFSIAIMDMRNGNLYVARDRYGIKPLYYALYDGKFVFASELKSIIQFHDFIREIDTDSVLSRLASIEPTPEVMLKHVSFVEPGTFFVVNCGGGGPH